MFTTTAGALALPLVFRSDGRVNNTGYVILGCLLAACTPKKEEAKPVPTASAIPTTATAPTLSSAPATSEAQFIASLFEKLEGEKRNRPNADPSVEKTFGTIEGKAKVQLDDKKQIAGWPIGARYCMKSVTKSDVHVVVCEFADAAAAAKGQTAASTTNKVIKRREVLLKNATSLSIQQSGETKQAESDAKSIAEAFKAL